DLVQFALELHHEQRMPGPHTLGHCRERVEVPVAHRIQARGRMLHTAQALLTLGEDVPECALRDRQARPGPTGGIRDIDLTAEFRRGVLSPPLEPLSLEIPPLRDQALTLLLEPLDPATLLGRLELRLRLRNTDLEFTLASIQRLPARGGHRTPDTLDRRLDLLDATSRVIDPGPQVVDRLLGNALSLVEPGGRLRRIRALDLGPHLVHVLRSEVADRKSTRLNSSHVKISYAV